MNPTYPKGLRVKKKWIPWTIACCLWYHFPRTRPYISRPLRDRELFSRAPRLQVPKVNQK